MNLSSYTFVLISLTLALLSTVDTTVAARSMNNNMASGSYAGLTGWWRRATSVTSDGSWLWGWAWGAESIVSVVDRSTPVSFPSRPASFGPLIEDPVLGYGIPMNAFTVPCSDNGEDQPRKKRGRRGGDGDDEYGFPGMHTHTYAQKSTNLGCPKLCTIGEKIPEPSNSWIAIVQRGQCSFVEKVREAQHFGAKAVVVGGDNPDESGNPDILVNMYSQGDLEPCFFSFLCEVELLTNFCLSFIHQAILLMC